MYRLVEKSTGHYHSRQDALLPDDYVVGYLAVEHHRTQQFKFTYHVQFRVVNISERVISLSKLVHNWLGIF